LVATAGFAGLCVGEALGFLDGRGDAVVGVADGVAVVGLADASATPSEADGFADGAAAPQAANPIDNPSAATVRPPLPIMVLALRPFKPMLTPCSCAIDCPCTPE
jgi:hypothetical protein